jgi:hypothetical protein
MGRIGGIGVFVLTVLVYCLVAGQGWAMIDKDALKEGMSLPDVVEAFGQPARVEWVNLKGQPMLFLFYPYDGFFDGLKQEDGGKVLPLGFVAEKLSGWGRKFYEQAKSPDS